MKKAIVIRQLAILTMAVLSIVFIITICLCSPEIAVAPESSGTVEYKITHNKEQTETITAEIGTDITAIGISDIDNVAQITKVNYVPNKFVQPKELTKDMQIVDLTKPFEFAEKGTLMFVILNLDAYAEDFVEQSERLNKYKQGDYWYLSFSLPNIFCASNVYVNSQLSAQSGEIQNYDFIKFNTSYDKFTSDFTHKTQTCKFDLCFYTRREALANTWNSSVVITIHYQSSGGSFSGIDSCPLIGDEPTISHIQNSANKILTAFTILSALAFAVLLALSLLKHAMKFIPSLIWTLAIMLLLMAQSALYGTSQIPLIWAAVEASAPFIVLGSALSPLLKKQGLRWISYAAAMMGWLLAFLCPFIEFDIATVYHTICIALKIVLIIALVFMITVKTIRLKDNSDAYQLAGQAIIAITAAASLFIKQPAVIQYDAQIWLHGVTVLLTFINVFIVLYQTEKNNTYLTENLNLEVERQVHDMRSVVQERDNLLRFVSHDMKKPLTHSMSLLDALLERESDSEQVKGLGAVKQNVAHVVENLSEIGGYAKFNYVAEQSQIVDLAELCSSIFDFHRPDCNANGILLKNSVSNVYKAFAKRSALENVVSNLIINAVEHAECSQITLSARSNKKNIILNVCDNGKGIEDIAGAFRPYVSHNSESTGIGLYLCKSMIESMNGRLVYERINNLSVFSIILLKV